MEAEPVISSMILADAAIVEQGTGKLTLIGCFHVIKATIFPCTHPGFFAVVTLTNLPDGETSFAMTVRVEVESTGHVLVSAGGHIKVNISAKVENPPYDARKLAIDIPIRLDNVVFPQQGAYSVVLLGNNEPLYKRNLIVEQIATRPPKPEIES